MSLGRILCVWAAFSLVIAAWGIAVVVLVARELEDRREPPPEPEICVYAASGSRVWLGDEWGPAELGPEWKIAECENIVGVAYQIELRNWP